MTKASQTLIFCFDGTGNEPSDAGEFKEDESISNILKLHVMLGGGLTDGVASVTTPSGRRQRAFYYNGIGTLEAGRSIPLLGRLYQAGRAWVNMTLAPTWGDAQRILDEAKADFAKADYRAGDKLVIFGYSRGAALARKFASRILAKHRDCVVAFLGVFDTVAAMNGIHRKGDRISSDVVFENGTLNDRVKRAVHLLALDEDRVPFTPTLMNKDADEPRRILEVWFPGVHGDVGGGYWQDGLSDVALEFMIEKCRNALDGDVHIEEDDREITDHLGRQDPDDALANLDVDDVALHPLSDGPLHAHTGAAAALMDQEVRSVHVSDHDRPSRPEDDLPLVHASVAERFASVPDYRPPALRGLTFRLINAAGVVTDPLRGIAGLRKAQKWVKNGKITLVPRSGP